MQSQSKSYQSVVVIDMLILNLNEAQKVKNSHKNFEGKFKEFYYLKSIFIINIL